MNENFVELFQESIAKLDLRPGTLVKATVTEITSDYVFVDAGLKSEDYIPIDEFKDKQNKLEVAVGDQVEVVLETIEDGSGGTRLSREKAKREESWRALETAYAENKSVRGIITEHVKGGFTVELGKIHAFLPASLIDVRPMRGMSHLEGKELDFKLIKLDRKLNNIVVSRRAVLTEETGGEQQAVLAGLQEGQEVIGIVKNLTDYGAFVDLGGIDGLLHITDMSWKRIKYPSEVVSVGDEIKVKVLKFDSEKKRVSLGLKQLAEDPWVNISRRYPVGTRLFGKVTNLTDYGCFVEIEDGIEGLVHVSEMDWTNKNVQPSKVVALGDEVEVKVLEIDEERRRISLGIKHCQTNPWQIFADTHKKGEKIIGKIKSITDFGIFVGLEGNIDGLIHLSDISWLESGERAIRSYQKGQEIEAMILAINAERERISLGIKQLTTDIYADYSAANPIGTVVTGKVTEVNPKAATIDLQNGVIGRLQVSEISKTRINDATDVFAVGDEVKATVIGFNKKVQCINLSSKEFLSEFSSKSPAKTKLGDLLMEQIEGKKE
jgi:small subunit ribosomal protein S1